MENQFVVVDDVAYIEIPLPNEEGTVDVKVDLDDLEKMKKFEGTWRVTKKNDDIEAVYIRDTYKGEMMTIRLHRLIAAVLDDPDVFVFHINGNKLDNRKANLNVGGNPIMTNERVELEKLRAKEKHNKSIVATLCAAGACVISYLICKHLRD